MLSDKELELLDKIQKKSVYEDKFFEKRPELKWFDELKKRGYFNPNPDTRPQEAKEKGYYSIPQWNVLPYLEKVSQQVCTLGNEKYIDDLLVIIKDVSNYKNSNGQHIDNYRTWYYFTKILVNLPTEEIPEDIITLIPVWLDSKFDTMLQGAEIATKLLPKFLTDNPVDIQKAEKIIDYITAYKPFPSNEEGKKKEFRLVVDSHWLKEAFGKYSESIGEKCSKELIEKIVTKIEPLLERKEDGTYTSFYDEPEYSIEDPLEMLTYILRRLLLSKAKADVDTTKEIIKEFVRSDYYYFPKMAIYIVGRNVENYSGLFWDMLDTDIGISIFDETLYFGDELKRLLNNLKELSAEQRETLHKKIEESAERQQFEEDTNRRKAIYKQRIYQALSHETYFMDLYNKMKDITGAEPQLHPAIGKVETWSGPGPSPLTKEEILRMTNYKLVEFLAGFRTKDSWKGPTVGGLANLIAEIAKDLPDKFIEDLTSFKDTGFIYVYEIMKGIKEAWNEKKNFDWAKVFKFIELYVDREEFWEDKFIVERDEWLSGATHQWVAGITAELIQDGTRDDDWAFPEQHFEIAEKIIFLLLDNLKADEDEDISDYVTYTLNTALGKSITALVLLALRIARVNDKKGFANDIKWSSKVRDKYEEILKKKSIEGFTNLGRYMPNFYYLNKDWLTEQIKALESEKGSNAWNAFIDGYLSIGRVYDNLYELMRQHYEYGLSYDFKDKRNREHLIQHICIGYLRGSEKLDEAASLFRKITEAWNADELREVISFFWMQRGILAESTEENKKMREKIIEFWKLLYGKYRDKDAGSLTRGDRQILSAASKLATLLDKIELESFEWLMLLAPYVHENFNSPFFIEYLDELKDKGDKGETAKYVGDIYLKMLEKITPDFDQKDIRSIVEFLYDAGETDSANKICDTYVARGAEFLRDICEKHANRT